MNLMSLIKQEEDILGLWQEETKEDEKKHTGKIPLQNLEMDIDADVAEIIPKVHYTFLMGVMYLNSFQANLW